MYFDTKDDPKSQYQLGCENLLYPLVRPLKLEKWFPLRGELQQTECKREFWSMNEIVIVQTLFFFVHAKDLAYRK